MSQIDTDKIRAIVPVTDAIQYVVEETRLASILHRGIIVLRGHDVYLRLAKKMALENSQKRIVPQIDLLLRDAPNLSKEADEISKNDFELVNRHAFISIWAAFESSIEDTIKFLLSHSSEPIDILDSFGISYKRPVFDTSDQSLSVQVRKIEQAARKKHELKIGKAYSWVFSRFDVHINRLRINDGALEEGNAVRNCILHNSGIVDERASKVSSLSGSLNRKIKITKAKYLQYYDAVGQFLNGLLEALISSALLRK